MTLNPLKILIVGLFTFALFIQASPIGQTSLRTYIDTVRGSGWVVIGYTGVRKSIGDLYNLHDTIVFNPNRHGWEGNLGSGIYMTRLPGQYVVEDGWSQCAVIAHKQSFDRVPKLMIPEEVYQCGDNEEGLNAYIENFCRAHHTTRDHIVLVADYFLGDTGIDYPGQNQVIQITLGLGLLDANGGGLSIGVYCRDDPQELRAISARDLPNWFVNIKKWRSVYRDPDDV